MKRFHYAWVVVAVTFLALLAAQAVRAAPGVIITSLESEFGWSRIAIAALAGGLLRDLLGDYHLMFISAGVLGFITVSLALRISTSAVSGRMTAPAFEAARP